MTQTNRALRYEGRQILRSVTADRRCQDCGRATISPGGSVGVRLTNHSSGRVAGYAGIASCGRIWLCPVCNAKVMARRAVDVGAALTWASVEGIQVIWGSLTSRHNAQSDLRELLDIHREAWRLVGKTRAWKISNATRQVPHRHHERCESECARRLDFIDTGARGRVGYIRASELTIGRNGWHPHFHPIIFYRGTPDQAQRFADALVREWVYGVEAAGGDARVEGSQQLRVLDSASAFDALSGYITKATYEPSALALETVWSQGKKGRGRARETVAHWQLLAEIGKGLADDVERWEQLEESINEHRMITWSRGLRSIVGIGADEKTDEEIAAEEVGTKDDTLVFLGRQGWLMIRDNYMAAQLLDVVEDGGMLGLRLYLDARGIPYMNAEEMAARAAERASAHL